MLQLMSKGFCGIYSFALLCPLFHILIDNAFRRLVFSVLWRRPGLRGQSHRKSQRLPPIQRSQFYRKIKQTTTGRILSCFPLKAAQWNEKIQPVKGVKRRDFANAKYYSALDWLDRRRGLMIGNLVLVHSNCSGECHAAIVYADDAPYLCLFLIKHI